VTPHALPASGLLAVAAFSLAAAGGDPPQVTGSYVSREEPLPGPEVRQPVAFSHRVHADAAKLGCLDCHEGATRGDAATIPQAEACLVCHASLRTESPEVAKLAAAAARGERLPWARVYQVPDFVFFGHREHLAGGVRCAECHGAVETRDALRKEVSTSMTACLECHRRRQAPVHCAACHVLGH
jgi:hypothetical protein